MITDEDLVDEERAASGRARQRVLEMLPSDSDDDDTPDDVSADRQSPLGPELPAPQSPRRIPELQDGGPSEEHQSDEESILGAEPYESSGDEYIPGQDGDEWVPASKRKKRRLVGRQISPVAAQEPKPKEKSTRGIPQGHPVPGTSRDNSARGDPSPGTARSAAARRSHNDEIYRKSLLDYYEQESLSADESNVAGRTDIAGPARRRPRSPPDEYVQLSVTTVYEPVHTSANVKRVMEMAAKAPAAAAMLLEYSTDETVPVLSTRVSHALCRAGEQPMANYSLQEPKPHEPVDTSGVRNILSELMAAERMWSDEHAQWTAQAAAHDRDMAAVRAAVKALRVPNAALHVEMDELVQRLKTYNEAMKTAYECRKSDERSLEDAVEEVLKYAAAAHERNTSA